MRRETGVRAGGCGVAVLLAAVLAGCGSERGHSAAERRRAAEASELAALIRAVEANDCDALLAIVGDRSLTEPIWTVPQTEACYPNQDRDAICSVAHLAASRGALTVLRRAIEEGEIDHPDMDGVTPLFVALRCCQRDAVQLLIDAGADPYPSSDRPSALEWAVVCDDVELVKLIGEASPELVNDPTIGVRTPPLHFASGRSRSIETLHWLVANGADVDQRSADGAWTPLHSAAASGKPAFIDALISYGATIESRNSDGMTPLFLAAGFATAENVRKLLELGADPMSELLDGPRQGYTPLDFVVHFSTVDVASVRVLLEHGARATSRTLDLARSKHPDNLELTELLTESAR